MLRLFPLPLALSVLATAAAAKAESTYSLLYRSVEGCPSREHFMAELGARNTGLKEATREAPDVSLEVWFEGHEPITGVLRLRDAQGFPTQRTIPGATCDEVVSALALTAALLIDAQRRSAPEPRAPREQENRGPPAIAPTPSAALRSTSPALGEEGSRTLDKAVEPSRLGVRVGVGAAAEHGIAPRVAVAGAFEIGVESRGWGIAQPLLAATFERTLAQAVMLTEGEAEFRWTALRLGFCPVRLPLDANFSVRPCALFEAGELQANGVAVPGPDEVSAPWWATGLSGRFELDLLDKLSGLVELGARVHLRQDRFYFDPDSPRTTIYEVPPAGLFGRAGVQGGF